MVNGIPSRPIIETNYLSSDFQNRYNMGGRDQSDVPFAIA